MDQSQQDTSSTETIPQLPLPPVKSPKRKNVLKAQIMEWMNDGSHSRVCVNDALNHFRGWGQGLVRNEAAAKKQIWRIFSQNSGSFHPYCDSEDPDLTTFSTCEHMKKMALGK